MKKFISIIIFFLLIIISAKSQIINGRIVDLKSNEAVLFANIFLEGTTIGTTSDENGYFVLDTKNKSTIPIIISTIGYQSSRILNYSSAEDLIVLLEPDTYKLGEFEIKASKINRELRLALFKAAFLGESKNAATCEILNEKVLQFNMNQETKILYARAPEPLVIINNALGYKITYNLKEFRRHGDDVYYSGDYFFSEIETDDKTELKRYKKNRERTYKGSRLSLIRSLYHETLKKNNFELYYTNFKKVKMGEIFVKELADGDKIIYFIGDLIVYHKYEDEDEVLYLTQEKTEKVATSYIKQKVGTRITRDGYFDPESIVWSGDITFYRVADLLPYDYNFKKVTATYLK